MNQATDKQMSMYDLPSKILCRVLNVELKVWNNHLTGARDLAIW